MKPQRPYLLRALYDWIVDSEEIPYLLVDATTEGVEVPREHVQDGQIILNVGPNAVRDLHISDEYMMFASRFDGRHFEIVLPMSSVRAIYCKDSGEGMVFPDETLNKDISTTVLSAGKAAVKDSTASGIRSDQAAESETADKDQGDDGDDPPDSPPTLRLV